MVDADSDQAQGPVPSTPLTDPPRTLGEAVYAASGREPVLVFHLEEGPRALSLDELRAAAIGAAAELAARRVGRGDRVGLLGPNRPEWAGWAHGAWLAGAALVPLPAPVRLRDPAAYAEQIRSLVDATDCRVVVAHPRFLSAVPDAVAMSWEGIQPFPDRYEPPMVEEDDTAMVLCTSGSTARPKGIRLSHATMLTRNAARWLPDQAQRQRWLGWNPFYHAAGLFSIVQPLLDGTECHVLPPERFARDPAEWLRLVGPTGATTISGPSSAWAAALRAVARDPSGVDFSSLELAFFGLEMVDPAVVDRLLEVGVPLGLRPEALCAGYGLSEGGGTMTPPGSGIRIDRVDLDELVSSGRAVPATGSRPAKRVASCGVPGPDIELRISGPNGPLPDRHVGEVLFHGLGLMDGYLGPDVPDPFEQGWLHTGDLGYVADGELFVTGRVKEIIVHFGRNYHPEDIEWAAARVAGVTSGGCVAFAPPGGEEGDVVLVVEASPEEDVTDLGARVLAAVTNAVGLAPRHVLVLPEGAIPRAPNGKLQRLAARESYRRGELATPT